MSDDIRRLYERTEQTGNDVTEIKVMTAETNRTMKALDRTIRGGNGDPGLVTDVEVLKTSAITMRDMAKALSGGVALAVSVVVALIESGVIG